MSGQRRAIEPSRDARRSPPSTTVTAMPATVMPSDVDPFRAARRRAAGRGSSVRGRHRRRARRFARRRGSRRTSGRRAGTDADHRGGQPPHGEASVSRKARPAIRTRCDHGVVVPAVDDLVRSHPPGHEQHGDGHDRRRRRSGRRAHRPRRRRSPSARARQPSPRASTARRTSGSVPYNGDAGGRDQQVPGLAGQRDQDGARRADVIDHAAERVRGRRRVPQPVEHEAGIEPDGDHRRSGRRRPRRAAARAVMRRRCTAYSDRHADRHDGERQHPAVRAERQRGEHARPSRPAPMVGESPKRSRASSVAGKSTATSDSDQTNSVVNSVAGAERDDRRDRRPPSTARGTSAGARAARATKRRLRRARR